MGHRVTAGLERHYDRLIGIPEGALIAAVLWAGHGVWLGLTATLLTVAGPAAAWIALRAIAGPQLPDRAHTGRFAGTLALWLLFFWVAYEGVVAGDVGRIHAVMATYIFAGLLGLRAWRRRQGAAALGECARLAALVLAGFWLLAPVLTPSLCGTGDGQWYATLLADMVRQVHAGVFPVFVGQSELQFNGAINPLRLAPGFHYLGAMLDAATGWSLDPVALLNLLMALVAAATAVVTYLCLVALAPRRRWLAGLAAFLYLACPGVLALPYKNDLYLTWLAAPLVPVVLYGCVRSFRRLDAGAIVCVAGATGLIWWLHSPVAIWLTAFVVSAQVIRLLCRRPRRGDWGREAAAVALFLAVAAYPLVSVLVVKPEAGQNVASFSSGLSAARGVEYIRSVFPAVLLPLRYHAPSIEDLQLGYSLWLLLLGALGAAAWRRSAPYAVLAAGAVLLVLLLTPMGGFTLVLWRWIPDPIIAVSGDYPMNRLYLLLAAFATVLGWLAVNPFLDRARPARRWLYPLAVILCVWSGYEGRSLALEASESWPPPPSGRRAMLPENAALTRYSYLSFGALPPYFTHGVADPLLESRLLDRATRLLLVGNRESIEQGTAEGVTPLGEGVFEADPKEIPIFHYRPSLTVEPGGHYAVILDPRHPDAEGTLIVQGESMFRLYALPEYGMALSFGTGPGHSHVLPLWTNQNVPEDIRFEFRTTGDWVKRDVSTLGYYQFIRYDPGRLPVFVTSLIPYRARVTAPADAWLETPRMYQDAYQAIVDGRRVAVAKSPAGLVMVPVPAGTSTVKVQYYPPFVLLASFWLSFLAALGVAAGLMLHLARAARADSGLATAPAAQ